MLQIGELVPDVPYWAFRATDGESQIVKISTVFGADREFWTVVVLGSDQHWSPEDFEFIEIVQPPSYVDRVS